MEIDILNCENEKKSIAEFCHSDLLSVHKCGFAQIPMFKTKLFKQLQTPSLKPLDLQFSNFTWSITCLQSLRIIQLGQVENPRWPL